MISLAAFTALVILTASIILSGGRESSRHDYLKPFQIPVAILIFLAAMVAFRTFSMEMGQISSLTPSPSFDSASAEGPGIFVLKSLFGAMTISGILCLVIWIGMGMGMAKQNHEKNEK
ncbi:MAG: hypothetical protein CVV64_07430 [Candidatus Wallbacteria bacterium HGW-Wallbacteria-1]|jgi:hypothetical protein|uniref:Uncharacterized protein n=1 Tax=Candidatus Wallbacteria bacterium HGW-Wallbacteria-1 TaxID=2013854 RepID=A0A2N1PQU7_9BACT|nr:MAG: hypothetical protein CVV64_07430 [Candidatus Wallbacteria bacterium HGW-Wallbacteria-1]